jgi:hypothetical protein
VAWICAIQLVFVALKKYHISMPLINAPLQGEDLLVDDTAHVKNSIDDANTCLLHDSTLDCSETAKSLDLESPSFTIEKSSTPRRSVSFTLTQSPQVEEPSCPAKLEVFSAESKVCSHVEYHGKETAANALIKKLCSDSNRNDTNKRQRRLGREVKHSSISKVEKETSIMNNTLSSRHIHSNQEGDQSKRRKLWTSMDDTLAEARSTLKRNSSCHAIDSHQRRVSRMVGETNLSSKMKISQLDLLIQFQKKRKETSKVPVGPSSVTETMEESMKDQGSNPKWQKTERSCKQLKEQRHQSKQLKIGLDGYNIEYDSSSSTQPQEKERLGLLRTPGPTLEARAMLPSASYEPTIDQDVMSSDENDSQSYSHKPRRLFACKQSAPDATSPSCEYAQAVQIARPQVSSQPLNYNQQSNMTQLRVGASSSVTTNDEVAGHANIGIEEDSKDNTYSSNNRTIRSQIGTESNWHDKSGQRLENNSHNVNSYPALYNHTLDTIRMQNRRKSDAPTFLTRCNHTPSPSPSYGDTPVHGKNEQISIQVLCSESFFDTWGPLMGMLASGMWLHNNSLNAVNDGSVINAMSYGPPIEFIDCFLVDICGVDIELPNRQAVQIVCTSSLESETSAKSRVIELAQLAALGRYKHLFVLICHDSIISAAVTRHILQLQAAVLQSTNGPPTSISFKTVSHLNLAAALAETIMFSTSTKDGCRILSRDIVNHDDRDKERAKFLLWSLPLLCASGALELLSTYASQAARDNQHQTFKDLFASQLVRQKIMLASASESAQLPNVNSNAILQLNRALEEPLGLKFESDH